MHLSLAHSGELHRHASVSARLRSLATLAKRKQIRSLLQILHNPFRPSYYNSSTGLANVRRRATSQRKNLRLTARMATASTSFALSNVGQNKIDLEFAMYHCSSENETQLANLQFHV